MMRGWTGKRRMLLGELGQIRGHTSAFHGDWLPLCSPLLCPAAFVVLIAYFRGKSAAVIEMADIILYSVALFGTAFLPVLLWILWLLPYKSLEEQPDLLGKQLHSRLEAVPPEKADVWDYAKHTNFLLYEAACLWVGSEPHSPITDKKRGPNVAN